MNKKVYKVPSMTVKNLFMQSLLNTQSPVTTVVSGDAQIGYGSGGTGGTTGPRSRQHSVWDTEDEDWDN